MRNLSQQILCLMLLAGLFSCEDEHGGTDVQPQSTVEFEEENLLLREDQSEGSRIRIHLSHAARANGFISLKIAESMQQRVQTIPAHENGSLALPIQRGESLKEFTIVPVDNTLAEGNQELEVTLVSSPGFSPGPLARLQLTIAEDDSELVLSTVTFEDSVAELSEGSHEAGAYRLKFTPAVTVPSRVALVLETEHAGSFAAVPSVHDQRMVLDVPVGATEISFSIKPENDATLGGHSKIKFTVGVLEGSLVQGAVSSMELRIQDDELVGKIKGYEVLGAESSVKKTFEYDAKGRLARVVKESYAPHNPIVTTDTYYYDAQDRVVKINQWLGNDVHFVWKDGKVERSEEYQDGVFTRYSNYAYDELGNLAGIEPFYKNREGQFKRGLFSVYLYFTDGNIYKELIYSDSPASEEPVLIAARSYEAYLDEEAPIDVFEALPHIKAQKNLPGTYRYEQFTTGHDSLYQLSYEYTTDGEVSKRTASAPSDTQVTHYFYY